MARANKVRAVGLPAEPPDDPHYGAAGEAPPVRSASLPEESRSGQVAGHRDGRPLSHRVLHLGSALQPVPRDTPLRPRPAHPRRQTLSLVLLPGRGHLLLL